MNELALNMALATIQTPAPTTKIFTPKPLQAKSQHRVSPALSLFAGGIAGGVEAAITVSWYQSSD
jgi:hypothetical protein